MEDKLVTLVTLTYNKALILKELLEKEGIEVTIANLHPHNPVVSSGVCIRIKESDLPHALKITESPVWLSESVVGEKSIGLTREESSEILVPVDFSSYSMQICEFAFHLAAKMNYKIILFHAYLTSMFASALSYGDSFTFPKVNDRESKNELKKVQSDFDALIEDIKNKIINQEFPEVKYSTVLREGVPEEEILKYAKESCPKLIVMGTRGKHQKDIDLMGSVTAEVIERSRITVLAIPDNTPLKDFASVKHIAFITNFEQFDLIAFDMFVKSWNTYKFSVSLLHLSDVPNTWNEIKLAGIKEYFHHQYPTLDIKYDIVKNDDLLNSLDSYIKENKIDVITMTSHKRNIFSRLFNPSIAQKMIFHSDTPLLVINID
jgi:nucleotide-binding universal stress UspA family protein